jgi:molybdenum cofactor cytidylyltransferase
MIRLESLSGNSCAKPSDPVPNVDRIMTAHVHILVLAAGASTRLGQPKQLVQIGGRSALHRVVSSAVAVAGNAVTVVVGAHAKELTYLLSRLPVSYVVNKYWEEGLASSLKCGLATVPAAADAVMIVLGDQVCVTSDDLHRLLSAWQSQGSVIAAATYEQTVGVPAIIPRAYFGELAELRGDEGARKVIKRNPDRLVRVPMPNAAIDLDTPEDLAALSARFRTRHEA